VEPQRRPSEEEKNERKLRNNNVIYHICVGITHIETYLKLLNKTGWGEKGEEVQWKAVTST
jgi:hypothetical protein